MARRHYLKNEVIEKTFFSKRWPDSAGRKQIFFDLKQIHLICLT